MEKQICPECGAPLNLNEHTEVCLECGFPLPHLSVSEMPTVVDAKSVESETVQSNDNKDKISAEIAESGCYDTWKKHCKEEYNITSIFTVTFIIALVTAIAVGIGFIAHLIVRGNKVDNNLILFLEFYKKTRKFTLAIAILAAVSVIFDSLDNCVELFLCSAWLRNNNVDTSKCATVVGFRPSSHNRKGAILHLIEIAYCAMNKEQSIKIVIAYVVKTVLTIGLYITAGFFAAIAINNLFILGKTEFFNPYLGFGYFAGAIAAGGLPGLLNNIINKAIYAPVISWASK